MLKSLSHQLKYSQRDSRLLSGFRNFLLLFFLSVGSVFAQDLKVTGKVSGEGEGELPGATIQVKGSNSGVVTDVQGNFTIYVKPDDILIISFIGFKDMEVAVNNRTNITVTLPADNKVLEEVVVVGYGEQKRANLTGAVTVVDTKELEDIPTGNLSQTLIGKLPGIQVDRNGTGIPGTPSPLVIRDESASGQQRQVLYVIDGVIYTGEQDGTGPSGDEVFNRLDPTEIESISVLKDAAAAVYGARGAGGVVLVKTKRGKSGQTRFNYTGSVGIGQPTQIPEMLTGYQHALMLNEINRIKKDEFGDRLADRNVYTADELEYIKGRDFDWLDGLFKSAVTQRHSMNVSGGSETVRYFIGGNYYYESGNYEDLWYKRYGVRSNIETDITKDLKLTLGLNFSEGVKKNPSYDPGSGDVGTGVLRDWYKRPLTAPKWIDPVVDGYPTQLGSSWNPYGLLESGSNTQNTSNNFNVVTGLKFDAPFVEGLSFSSQFSYNVNTSVGTTFNQNYDVYPLIGNDTRLVYEDVIDYAGIESGSSPITTINNSEGLSESSTRGINYQLNFSTNYSKKIGNHNIGAVLVYEQADGQSKKIAVDQYGSDIRGFPYVWAFSQDGVLVRGEYHQLGRWGVVGRLNYDYKGKYILESTFRSESSTKFAPDERFGIFPSASVGWVASEEPFFMNNVNFIDFLKIRVSVGLVGNDNIRAFEYQPSFNAQGASGPIFGSGNGSVSNTVEPKRTGLTVPSRTWSKTNNNNIGLDIRALEHRLSFTFEYYYNRTYDGFQANSTVPFVIGNPKPPEENYKISFSTGLEFAMGWSDKIGDISYSFDANFTKRRSRPLKLYQNPAVLGVPWRDELLLDDSNQPGYIALGIIRTQEDIEMLKEMYFDQSAWARNAAGQMVPTIGGVPIALGMLYYADVGGANFSTEPDGRINGDDTRVIAKYTTPPYSYGFSLGVGWKGIKLSGSFGGAFGHKEFINKDEQTAATSQSNVFSWWNDYWTPDNPNASMPRPYNWGYEGQHSTFWMRDGHTLRLNFVNLSYNMPKKLSDKLKLSSWRMFVSATNVWTIISPFDYKDPAVSRAYDYPLVRTISIGTNFSL